MKYLLTLLLLIPIFSYSESLLCIGDATGGLHFNSYEKKFEGTKMSTNYKYTLKKEGKNWTVNQMGYGTLNATCRYADEPKLEIKRLFCNILAGEFVVDIEQLKFVRTYWGGFEEEKDGNTPFIERGNCSEI